MKSTVAYDNGHCGRIDITDFQNTQGMLAMSAKELATVSFDYSKVDKETKGKLTTIAGQVRRGKGNYVKSVMELGEAIHAAHELLAGEGREGQFSQWVEAECNIDKRTAYNYMHAFERFGKCEIISHLSPTAMYALAAPEAPKQAAKEAEKLANKGEHITVARAKELVERFREIEKPKPRPAPKANPHDPATADFGPVDPPAEPNECAPGKHKWDDEGGCEKCHVAKAVAEPKPAQPPPPEHRAMFADLMEHFRLAMLLIDKAHNATGKAHAQLHDSVMNSLDCANIDAAKWRKLCK